MWSRKWYGLFFGTIYFIFVFSVLTLFKKLIFIPISMEKSGKSLMCDILA